MESVNLKYRVEEEQWEKEKKISNREFWEGKGNLTKKARIKSFALDKYSTKL